MNKHFFKLLFGSLFLVAATAFVGCSDDDDDPVAAKLTATPASIEFTDKTEMSQTFVVNANNVWELQKADDMAWATVTPTSGKSGKTTVTVKVEAMAAAGTRSGAISFTIKDDKSGTTVTSDAKVTVKQTKGETPVTDPSITKVDPETLSFTADATKAQTVTVTTANADGCTIEASANNAQFTVTVAEKIVTVTPKANTGDAITAKLTINLMKDGKVVATKDVAVSQEAGTVTPGEDTKGVFESAAPFMIAKSISAQAAYPLFDDYNNKTDPSQFNGKDASGVKLGTGKKTGFFTSTALGVTGSKKLSFYAVAWKEKTATVYVRVNNGGSATPVSVDIAANIKATANAPYTMTVEDSDYYTFELTGLTAESTITLSTDANFGFVDNEVSGRAIIAGIQIY